MGTDRGNEVARDCQLKEKPWQRVFVQRGQNARNAFSATAPCTAAHLGSGRGPLNIELSRITCTWNFPYFLNNELTNRHLHNEFNGERADIPDFEPQFRAIVRLVLCVEPEARVDGCRRDMNTDSHPA